MMPWQSLSSSMLVRATYDPDTGTLYLQFASGQTYTYDDVPVSVYTALLEADSPGQYYHANIKGTYS